MTPIRLRWPFVSWLAPHLEPSPPRGRRPMVLAAALCSVVLAIAPGDGRAAEATAVVPPPATSGAAGASSTNAASAPPKVAAPGAPAAAMPAQAAPPSSPPPAGPAPAAYPPPPPPAGAAPRADYPAPPAGYPAPPTYPAPPGYPTAPPGYGTPPPAYAPAGGYPPGGYPPGAYPPGAYPPGAYPYPYPYPGLGARVAGAETHDGFYLRMHGGVSFSSFSAKVDGDELSTSGAGASFGIALGAAVARNLILYGVVSVNLISNPEFRLNGATLGQAGGNSSIDAQAIGAGLAYYLDPSNVFLSGALLFPWVTLNDENGNRAGETATGVGFEGSVGREWWVSDNWGLGAAIHGTIETMKDKDPLVAAGNLPRWRVAALSFVFSATYN